MKIDNLIKLDINREKNIENHLLIQNQSIAEMKWNRIHFQSVFGSVNEFDLLVVPINFN